MSRTFRKKRGQKPSKWITHDYVSKFSYISNCGKYRRWYHEWVPLEGKDLKRSLARYRSDTRVGLNSPPSWFVTLFFEKKFRARSRQELKRILREEDYEGYEFVPYKRGAGWSWW